MHRPSTKGPPPSGCEGIVQMQGEPMNQRPMLLTVAMAVLVLGLSQAARMSAQDHGSHATPPAADQSRGMADMMKMHDQMMADMHAAEARLDGLIKEMSASSGDAKVAAIAAVVTELAAQQKSMHARMAQMHQQMMGGRGMMTNR